MRRNQRSAEGEEAQRLYQTKIWRGIRRQQLARHPLCAMCEKEGRLTPATVCDHIEPHKCDWIKFVNGPFQSLCTDHHNTTKQQQELLGYSKDVGADGHPLDPEHPFFKKR